MSFVHLHTHTEYSLLDGSNKIKEYVAQVKKLGMTAAAITDHGAMFGVIDFYRAAGRRASSPSWAVKFTWLPIPVSTRRPPEGTIAIIIWCCWRRINQGYANLMKIVIPRLCGRLLLQAPCGYGGPAGVS